MDQKKLNEILEKHSSWLQDEMEGTRANLRGADLYGAGLRGADLRGADLRRANLYGADLYEADLYGADLRGADLRRANLYGTDLRGTDLYGADLRGANLYGTDLRGTDLRGADLRGANLYGTDLRGTDLRGTDLHGADLRGTDLYGADLRGADLRGTDLYGADLRGAENVPYIPMACPDTGAFIAWKKAYDEDAYLVKLLIPEDARRSSATGRKCRADKAVVLSIEPIVAGGVIPEVVHSKHDKSFTYKVGQTVVAPDFDTDRFNECAPGIHFFINRQEAIDYCFT